MLAAAVAAAAGRARRRRSGLLILRVLQARVGFFLIRVGLRVGLLLVRLGLGNGRLPVGFRLLFRRLLVGVCDCATCLRGCVGGDRQGPAVARASRAAARLLAGLRIVDISFSVFLNVDARKAIAMPRRFVGTFAMSRRAWRNIATLIAVATGARFARSS